MLNRGIPHLSTLDPTLVELLKSMLKFDPVERTTVDKILNSAWISNENNVSRIQLNLERIVTPPGGLTSITRYVNSSISRLDSPTSPIVIRHKSTAPSPLSHFLPSLEKDLVKVPNV